MVYFSNSSEIILVIGCSTECELHHVHAKLNVLELFNWQVGFACV